MKYIRLKFVISLFMLFMSNVAVSESSDSSFIEKYKKINSLFHSGDVVSSIEEIDSSLQEFNEPGPINILLKRKLEICAFIGDVRCIFDASEDYRNAPLVEGAEGILLIQRAYYSTLGVKYSTNREEWLKGIPDQKHWGKLIGFSHPPMYVRTSLLEAIVKNYDDKSDEVRLALDRALTSLVTLKAYSDNEFGYLLVEALSVLALTGDSRRAIGLLKISRNYLEYWATNSVVKTFFLRLMIADIYRDQASVEVSYDQLTHANELLQKIKFPAYLKQYWQRVIDLNLVLICVIIDDTVCITSINNKYDWPELSKIPGLEEKMINGDDYALISVKILSASLTGGQVSDEWLQILNDVDRIYGPDSYVHLLRSYGKYVRFLYFISRSKQQDSPNLNKLLQELIAATESRIASFSSRLKRSGDGLALPDMFTRVLFKLTATVLSNSDIDTQQNNAELLFKISEIINRNNRNFDSDVLAVLSSAKDIREKRIIQSRQRIASKRFLNERRFLLEQINYLKKSSANRTETELDLSSFNNIRDLKSLELKLNSKLDQNIFTKAHQLPSLKNLRDVLNPDEAYITLIPGFKNYLITCITQDSFSLGSIALSVDVLEKDKKLLMAALEASYPPSKSLDRQYPVTEANRIYQAIFEPIKECLENVNHLIWSDNSFFHGMPLSALLTKLPNGENGKYDFTKAAWLVRHFSLSNVLTAKAFIASRKLSKIRASSDSFLGVGNPILTGTTLAGIPQIDTVTRNILKNRSGSLTTLQELPETEDELLEIKSNIGVPSIILTQDNATERRLRRQPLSQFKTINFATHGVLKNEIEGLGESALVLTPHNILDEWDDGQLTATEIADLDLNAELVGLSACNTAKFDVEEFSSRVPGLASAFSMAGAGATIATLWPVETITSKSVMSQTFKNYQNSEEIVTAADALKMSLESFIADPPTTMHAHPRFWAPFIVYGDANHSQKQSDLSSDGLLEFKSLTSWDNIGGGDIVNIFPSKQNNGFYIAGVDTRENNGRFHSFVSFLNSNGKEQWTLRDQKIAYRYMVEDGDQVFVLGYISTPDYKSIPAIYSTDNNGTRLWQKELDISGNSVMPIGIEKANQDFLLTVNQIHKADAGSPITSINATVLDTRANIQKQNIFQLPSYTSWHSTRYFSSGDNIYIAVHENSSFDRTFNVNKNIDQMGALKTCYVPGKMLLLQLDPITLNFLLVTEANQIELDDVLITQSLDVLFAGNIYDTCEMDKHAAVFKLDNQNKIKPLYIDDEPFDSRSAAIFQHNNGSIMLIGTTTRPLGARLQTEWKKSDDPLQEIKQVERFQRGEGFMQSLSLDGTPLEREWLITGGNVSLSDAATLDGNVLLGGSVDWQVGWGLYTQ